MSRATIQPIVTAIPAARQEGARHYGVHPYFTRRAANVVRAYVERYSQAGDLTLDPFGGTGVTAVEAFLMGRRAIQNDLNPFANFIARNIVDTTLFSTAPLNQAFGRVEAACAAPLREIEASEASAQAWLKRLPLPENIRLPRNSDAERYYEMFTPRQLAGLALLKQAIDQEPDETIRNLLLLAWSASIAKLNKTFLSAKGRAESRGGSSIFSIYRYKLAARCVELPIWETFSGRYRNVLAAKEEVLQLRDYRRRRGGEAATLDSAKNFQAFGEDAAQLDRFIAPASVDYIFTDPPYGGFISYLDLSILWNHWLGFPVSDSDRAQEAIVGGECGHSEEHYKESLGRCLATAFALLKPDRWMSVVFQHWDVSYFATILDTASDCGAQLKAAVTQTGDVIWSMHKKKNSASIIAGEFILTFYKPELPSQRASPTPAPVDDPEKLLNEVFAVCLGERSDSFTNEDLFNRLVIELWRRRALSCLELGRDEFADQLERRGWAYNVKSHLWTKLGQQKAIRELTLFDQDSPPA